jgi:hypothetical protein
MTKSLLFVESKPASPDLVEEYHHWHDRIHVPEMLAVDGLMSARRWSRGECPNPLLSKQSRRR